MAFSSYFKSEILHTASSLDLEPVCRKNDHLFGAFGRAVDVRALITPKASMEAQLVQLVEHYLGLHSHVTAIFFAERLFAHAGGEANAHLLGTAYFFAGRYRQTAELLQSFRGPANRFLFARACVVLGRWQDAEDSLLQRIRSDYGTPSTSNICQYLRNDPTCIPNGAAGVHLLADICRVTGRLEAAAAYYKTALALDSFSWSSYESLCSLGEAPPAPDIFGPSPPHVHAGMSHPTVMALVGGMHALQEGSKPTVDATANGAQAGRRPVAPPVVTRGGAGKTAQGSARGQGVGVVHIPEGMAVPVPAPSPITPAQRLLSSAVLHAEGESSMSGIEGVVAYTTPADEGAGMARAGPGAKAGMMVTPAAPPAARGKAAGGGGAGMRSLSSPPGLSSRDGAGLHGGEEETPLATSLAFSARSGGRSLAGVHPAFTSVLRPGPGRVLDALSPVPTLSMMGDSGHIGHILTTSMATVHATPARPGSAAAHPSAFSTPSMTSSMATGSVGSAPRGLSTGAAYHGQVHGHTDLHVQFGGISEEGAADLVDESVLQEDSEATGAGVAEMSVDEGGSGASSWAASGPAGIITGRKVGGIAGMGSQQGEGEGGMAQRSHMYPAGLPSAGKSSSGAGRAAATPGASGPPSGGGIAATQTKRTAAQMTSPTGSSVASSTRGTTGPKRVASAVGFTPASASAAVASSGQSASVSSHPGHGHAQEATPAGQGGGAAHEAAAPRKAGVSRIPSSTGSVPRKGALLATPHTVQACFPGSSSTSTNAATPAAGKQYDTGAEGPEYVAYASTGDELTGQSWLSRVESGVAGVLSLCHVIGTAVRALSLVDTDTAIAVLTGPQLPMLHKKTAYVQYLLGLAYTECGRFSAARSSFLEMRSHDCGRMEGLDVLSTVLWQMRRGAELAALAQELVARDPNDAISHIVAGNSFSLLKKRASALLSFERAVALDGSRAYPYCLLGLELLSAGSVEKAAEAFRAALSLEPRSYRAWHGMGLVLLRSYGGQPEGDKEQALAHFKKAAELHPRSATLAAYYGACLYSLGRLVEASTVLEGAIGLDPGNGFCHYNLAQVMRAQGKHEQERRELLICHEASPRELAILVQLGKACKRLGRLPEAGRFLNLALEVARGSVNPISTGGIPLVTGPSREKEITQIKVLLQTLDQDTPDSDNIY